MKKSLWILGLSVLGIGFIACCVVIVTNHFTARKSIKIGILHSRTGPMAASEKNLIDAELMAIDEINQAGGIQGCKLVPIIADGKSDELIFRQEAERLIVKEKVAVIVGCWRSADRKNVKDIVERYDNLLLYPVQYEGLEASPNIMYAGSSPNQSIIPAVSWCFKNLGKRFFLVGSDHALPRITNKIVALHLTSLGGEVVGEEYIKLNGHATPALIQTIVAQKPDVIINTIDGDTNISFFKELLDAGITAEKIPIFSTNVSEADFKRLPLDAIINTYSIFTYYEASPNSVNREFVQRYKARYGEHSDIGDNMQSAYDVLHMWAEAYLPSSPRTADVVARLEKIVRRSPQGIIYFDANHHMWQTSIIGKFAYNNQFVPIWESGRNIRPEPYPPYLTKEEWEAYLMQLYESWGKRWSAP